MKRATHWYFVLALFVGLSTGLAVPESGRADDTEVYLGSTAVPATIRPNVLFILDTSGSMSEWVDGTGMDRLDNMKVALKKILDTINNVNVGLMRFTDPGGPILYPVSYIDEDISVVENGDPSETLISSRIDRSSDDAEENEAIDLATVIDKADLDAKRLLTPGIMDTTGLVLDMMETQGSASVGGTVISKKVRRDSDDAEQHADGSMVLNGSTFGIGYDDGQQQLVGMRFRNLDIPQGATILNAKLQFGNKENRWDTGFSLRIQGHDVDDAPTFSNSWNNIGNRITAANGTTATVDWNNPASWTSNGYKDSPDISSIIQEIIDRPGWVPNNELALIVYPTTATSNNKSRRAYTHESNSNRAPRLVIEWTTQATPGGLQQIGLRFNEIGVPQGAKIKSATIEFRPQRDDSSLADFKIYGEDSDNAQTFGTTNDDISTRPRTSGSKGKEDWDVSAWSTGVATSTPDLKDIVQQIVDRPGWCGNNSMAFLFEPDYGQVLNGKTGPRIADSFDSDPTNAPLLKIEYDATSVSSGACINQWVSFRLSDPNDDVEEVLSTGSMDMNSSDLDFDDSKMSGMRFPGLPINQGQKILDAYIEFTADSDQSGAVTLEFNGQAVDDAPPFLNNAYNVSTRGKTSAANKVTWNPVDQTDGEVYRTPALTGIVQEIVDRPGWKPGNALVIMEEHKSGADRKERTTTDGARAPVLWLKVNGMLANGGKTGKTVRTELKEVVDNLDHNGYTPVVDTLYEAARYFRGDSVYWGKYRGWDRDGTYSPNPNSSGSNDNVRQNSRVSHSSSYTGGSEEYPGDCDPDDLNNYDCIKQSISGSPVYTSPITNSCQENHIIVLTDGYANHNHSEDLIKTYTGVGSCTENNKNENCGRDLAKFLNTTDNSPEPGDQNIRVHTIGFNFTSQWLKDVAKDGGGDFKQADTADQLASEILASFSSILSRTSSFATPSLSVNAFNKLEHNTDVYFSLFKPEKSVRWDGNVKKYQLCDDSSVCTVGEVLDETGAEAIAKVTSGPDEEGRIKTTASSFWDTVQDGNEIKVGGSGRQVPAPNGSPSRVVLTYTDTTNAPDYDALDVSDHRVLDTDDDGILDGLTGTTAANRQLTQELLGDTPLLTTDAEREDLIDWMRGEDIDGLEDITALATAGRRYPLNDPLHSEPVAITFGGTSTDPVIKLIVGTNGGGISLTNAYNGIEEWVFFPQATLAKQPDLKDNFNGDRVKLDLYGIDGSPSVWVNDRNGDGIITPGTDSDGSGIIEADEGDFVRVFIGMRRGGNNIYALDLIPNAPLASTDKDDVGDVKPTYMWRIEGGTGSFPELGQTWSKPKLVYMDFGTNTAGETERRPVLVFGGGYDTTQDGFDTSAPYSDVFGAGGDGNAIYFVDPYTGARLFVISDVDHGSSEQVQVSAMEYPIPSDVTIMDTNDDGATDRIYVGDTGGQMWRVDLSADLSTTPGLEAIVGMVATVSGTDPTDRRKFFYPPDVVRVHNSAYNTNVKYDLVTVTTGNRAHPLGDTTLDRLYAFKDENFYGLSDTDGDGVADPMNTLQGPLVSPATVGDLVDHTDVFDFTVQANVDALTASKGWYIDLESPGEKGLAKTTVTAGRLAFTTYQPQGVVSAGTCSLAEGAGVLYEVDVLTGAPVQNFDGIGDDTNLTKSDRSTSLGAGIPSQVVPVFIDGKILYLVGTSGGATTFDPGINFPTFKSVWFKDGF